MALGILVGALTIGTAAPHLVNGLGGLEWQTVIWATSAVTVGGGLIAGFLVPRAPIPSRRRASTPPRRDRCSPTGRPGRIALTLELALGFTLTVATIWLIPVLERAFGWRWAFAFLAPGPLVGIGAMARLRALQGA